jgi:hypothetical protein
MARPLLSPGERDSCVTFISEKKGRVSCLREKRVDIEKTRGKQVVM